MTDPTLAKALAHPLRTRILGLLVDRTASPSELAGELDAPLGVVSYHVRRLASLGLLRLVKKVPKRGTVQHYYAAVERMPMSASQWVEAPSVIRQAALSAELSQLGAHVSSAVAAGGFDEEHSHLSRTLVTVDERGLKALSRELERMMGRIQKIEADCKARKTRAAGPDERQTTVVVMLFNSPTGRSLV
jgi:DNA-binding transcriptional ArsR family regulator